MSTLNSSVVAIQDARVADDLSVAAAPLVEAACLASYGRCEAVKEVTESCVSAWDSSGAIEDADSGSTAPDSTALQVGTVRLRWAINRSWLYIWKAEPRRALDLLRVLEPAVECLPSRAAELIRTEVELLRAFVDVLQCDRRTNPHVAGAGRELVSADEIGFAASVLNRLIHWRNGEIGAFHKARHPLPQGARRHLKLLFGCDRAMDAAVELTQLRFGVGECLAMEAMKASPESRHGPGCFLAEVVLARIHYERGDLARARAGLERSLVNGHSVVTVEAASLAYPLLARIFAALGRPEVALAHLRDGEALAQSRHWTLLRAKCLGEEIEILLRLGHVERGVARLSQLETLASPGELAIQMDSLRSRAAVDLALGEHGPAVGRLRLSYRKAIAGGDLLGGARVAVMLVEALASGGEVAAARQVLLNTLKLGSITGLFQTLAECGPRMQEMLMRMDGEPACEQWHLRPYIGTLLAEWNRLNDRKIAAARYRSSATLSVREANVLSLIRKGFSNKRVASSLSIAPETVKSHLKRIFVKLSAKTRMEAVSRAEGLGII